MAPGRGEIGSSDDSSMSARLNSRDGVLIIVGRRGGWHDTIGNLGCSEDVKLALAPTAGVTSLLFSEFEKDRGRLGCWWWDGTGETAEKMECSGIELRQKVKQDVSNLQSIMTLKNIFRRTMGMVKASTIGVRFSHSTLKARTQLYQLEEEGNG